MNHLYFNSLQKPNIGKRLLRFFVMVLVLAATATASLSSLLFAESETAAQSSTKNPSDGLYRIEAQLKGGTGRVKIHSPVEIEVKNGEITAVFIWTSSFYEYMLVDGQKHLPENRDKEKDTTTFRIPLKAIETFPFVAQTSKMSRPYDIEYSIEFDPGTLKKVPLNGNLFPVLLGAALLVVIIGVIMRNIIFGKKPKAFMILVLLSAALTMNGCGAEKTTPEHGFQDAIDGVKWLKSEEILYAEGFKIDYFERDIALIQIKEQNYLVVPHDIEVHKESAQQSEQNTVSNPNSGVHIKSELANAVIIKRPEKIYLTAPAALSLVHDIGEMSKIKYTGTKKDSWALDYAVEAMNKGEMIFAGKYSSPDFEKLVDEKCDLAVFSTMITHAPEIGEKFTELGIPVFIDYSSYEKHPLGRTEWVKVYGAILNKRAEANKLFSEQRKIVEDLASRSTGNTDQQNSGQQGGDLKEKIVALFTISPSGRISARRYDDYVSKMIDIAGGKYAYYDVSDVQISAMNIIMEPEVFFKETSKADIIIYNSTIGGGYDSIAAMVETNPVLADLPAIKAGDVWITTKSFFQSTTSHGNMIVELSQIIKGEADENTALEFFKKLK
ncbi:MAG: ABC transporter substrate-binding protein [Bacillota bacterium]|nr:ABC transporter substrate-binding protein [Bacillota bacterium]